MKSSLYGLLFLLLIILKYCSINIFLTLYLNKFKSILPSVIKLTEDIELIFNL